MKNLFKVALFSILNLCIIVVNKSSIHAQQTPNHAYIPLEKGLAVEWKKSLFEKGERKVYQGEELNSIAMPCGGIGAGQVEILGDGRLSFTESIFNEKQQPNAGNGLSTGYQYLNPQKIETKVNTGFSLIVKEKGEEPEIRHLDGKDFDAIEFIGEYPVAQIDFKSKGKKLPLSIQAEVFSPFIPGEVRYSANPVTVMRYTITNTGKNPVEATLAGWLMHIDFPEEDQVTQMNTLKKSGKATGILYETKPLSTANEIVKHPQLGSFSLAVLDEKAAWYISGSHEDQLKELLDNSQAKSTKKTYTSIEPTGAGVSSHIRLAPNESKAVTFFVSWYFPNYYEYGRRYEQAKAEAPGWVGHIYNTWYDDAFDVVEYMASNFELLHSKTKLFRDTYYDTTLPYWLASRISMPLSTMAAGNIAIWENGRLYGYEGVGFCQGTCGHVYNFVATIANLFPELERSVRLMQDFNSDGPYSGFSTAGRINFRGYGANDPNAVHSYASDAQSGYVLKAYREHRMSKDTVFLKSVWDKVKLAIGYHIFKDGAEIGLEPNGVLEGKQTFWDPMWYGPNPYNNTLYLAALRAVEEMAIIMGENDLAARYHRLFESGQKYMNEKMWNGEYYVHLYPQGFKGDEGVRNGFSTPEIIDGNAERFIEQFNSGEPNYFMGTGCDAQQLFGQNWANQLNLGYILPKENCYTAAKSIYKYNFTPDIATVYDFQKPKARTLAASGEAAMVNGSWPKERPKAFENLHDKTDVWTGLEYEASCDMINEGLLEEGLTIIKSIHERYGALKRNPWNEIEGSDHYSRAMHAWNVLLALGGYAYDGPAGKIGIAPRITPENYRSFFSTAEGWGSIGQRQSKNEQINTFTLNFGQLRLNTISLALKESKEAKRVQIELNSKIIKDVDFTQIGNRVTVSFPELNLKENQELIVSLKTR